MIGDTCSGVFSWEMEETGGDVGRFVFRLEQLE